MTLNILPSAKTQFIDGNGVPLASGFVFMYVPNTTTLKTTWQDSTGTIPNANPIILDASGEAIIWGSGAYRQIVQDSLGNTVWDQVTVDPGYAMISSFSGTSITSVSVGSGAKSFTTQAGLQFFAGQTLVVASAANASNSMVGTVTSYNSTTGALVMNITSTSGSGTHADWNISISGPQGPAGTVTGITVATANGFAGTSSGGFVPNLTLTTTVTGLVKGNATAISAAVSGTDYSAGTSSLATGIVKSTNTTGALSIAVAADFPTLNQNTTGTAANVTTNANLTGPITSVGNATSVTAAGITEAALGFTDVTTANVTTLKHGLTPKLPGTATVYLDGSGAYSTPPLTLTLGSSTTSLTIGTGSKVYTTQAGLAITAGQFLVTPSAANSSNYMFGIVTSYVGTTLTLNVTATGGSGTFADWNIAPSGPQGNAGGGSGIVNSGTANQLAYYGSTGTTLDGNANATITNGDLVLGQSGTQGSVKYFGSSTGFTIVKSAAAAGSTTVTLPAATDTLVGKATTDTLTNKTLTAPVIATIVNSGTLTLPTSTDTLVGKATTDTLTNKTLTAPVIATIVNSGTLTLPTTTDTLVGRATTDTLTNKTFNASNNTVSNITEAMQTLADNTTNNVSTTKHGYAPKAPNVATQYLDGTGAYSTPAAGNTILLSAQNAAGSSSVVFTSVMSSSYDEYILYFNGLYATAGIPNISLRTSTNNGVGYDSTNGNYYQAQFGGTSASTLDQIDILFNGGALITNSGVTASGSIRFYNMNTTGYKRMVLEAIAGGATGASNASGYNSWASRSSSTAINAIQVFTTSSTFGGGNFRLVGIKNS